MTGPLDREEKLTLGSPALNRKDMKMRMLIAAGIAVLVIIIVGKFRQFTISFSHSRTDKALISLSIVPIVVKK